MVFHKLQFLKWPILKKILSGKKHVIYAMFKTKLRNEHDLSRPDSKNFSHNRSNSKITGWLEDDFSTCNICIRIRINEGLEELKLLIYHSVTWKNVLYRYDLHSTVLCDHCYVCNMMCSVIHDVWVIRNGGIMLTNICFSV